MLWILLLWAGPSAGRDIYVAVDGDDLRNSGGSGDPYRTIGWAIERSHSGDVIRVRAGTYAESELLPRGGTHLVSEDGLYAARIYSQDATAVRLQEDASGIDGFEIYADWNVPSYTTGDGLVRTRWSNNTWIKNCFVHDACFLHDCIKINGTNVLVENCVAHSPGREGEGLQHEEVIDIFDVPVPNDGVTIRGCWLYHTPEHGGDFLIYAKGGARNVVWESNLFGPAETAPNGNCAVSAGAAVQDPVFPACENLLVRNNVFAHCGGDGAFCFTSTRNCHVYNNVFYDYVGGRSVLTFWSIHPPGGDRNEDCYVYNNVFLQSNGRPVYTDRGWEVGHTLIPVNFQHDHNVYHQADLGGDVDIYSEAHSIFADPRLAAPAVPDRGSDAWADAVARFLLQTGSPAIDAGYDLPLPGQPYGVSTDVLGAPRPAGPRCDIGAHERAPVLASNEPGADGTLAKTQNNVVRLIFDSAIALPEGSPALSIVTADLGTDVSDRFSYAFDVDDPNGSTLKAVEDGARLSDLTWYAISPSVDFRVAAFSFDLCTVFGDANGTGRVTTADYGEVKDHMGQYADSVCDLNGSGRVTTSDYSVVKANMAHRAPPKP